MYWYFLRGNKNHLHCHSHVIIKVYTFSCTILKKKRKRNTVKWQLIQRAFHVSTDNSACVDTSSSCLYISKKMKARVKLHPHYYCQMQRVGFSEMLQNGKCSEVMVEATDIGDKPHYSCHFQWISYSTNTKEWQPEAAWHKIHISASMHASGWGGRTFFS